MRRARSWHCGGAFNFLNAVGKEEDEEMQKYLLLNTRTRRGVNSSGDLAGVSLSFVKYFSFFSAE